MPPYFYHPTDHFSTRLNKIKENNPVAYARIRNVMDRIMVNPDAGLGTAR